MGTLRLALAQINPTMGALAANAEGMLQACARARAAGADLVVFPELALCGYPPEDLLLQPQFLADNAAALADLAARLPGPPALVGYAREEQGRVYNAVAVLAPGRTTAWYAKQELPNYGVFDEKRYFAPGSEPLVLLVAGAALGVTICEDIWVPGNAAERFYARQRVDVVLNLSASPFHAHKLEVRHGILSRFARAARAPLAYVNLLGGQDELVFDGGNMLVDPAGRTLASSPRFVEDLLLYDLPVPDRPRAARPGAVRLEAAAGRARPAAPARLAPELSAEEEIYAALVLGTRDYLRKNGFSQAVIGLSGGIDSALTAAVAVAALGPEQVTGVTMPSRYTSPETLADAAAVAGNLGIRLLNLPLEPVFRAFGETLAGIPGFGAEGLAYENLQARIRGNLLMALSNRFGWLVLTTGNKSEIATGYCTLYGDMAGGFAVIKDVPKTTVYALSRYVNRLAGRAVIPESVLVRPPTAELRPNQQDTDSLPPYAQLDPILKAYVEEDRAPAELEALGFDRDVVRKVIELVDRNEYKRRQAPPGVKITPKAFGRDRRLPITNQFRGYRPQPKP